MNWTRLGRTPSCPSGIARYIETPYGIYVYADGTRNRREWRHNFMVRRTRVDGTRVRVNERDFAQAMDIYMELHDGGIDISRIKYVLGFSRGGAVAQCLALVISWVKHIPAPTCIVYASKRTGNRALYREVKVWNNAIRCDIVPHLPPWYAKPKTHWYRDWMWPVKAHLWAAHQAAAHRHELTTLEEI